MQLGGRVEECGAHDGGGGEVGALLVGPRDVHVDEEVVSGAEGLTARRERGRGRVRVGRAARVVEVRPRLVRGRRPAVPRPLQDRPADVRSG